MTEEQMKNKIAGILEGSIDPWGERDENDVAQEILDLLKEESWKPPEEIPDCEICLEKNEEAMRDKGWLHKDDPVKGLRVQYETDKEIISVSLTVGEALEQLLSIVTYREISYACKYTLSPFLTTKDGGRIVR